MDTTSPPKLELAQYLPAGFKIRPTRRGLEIVAPNDRAAIQVARGMRRSLQESCNRIGNLWIVAPGGGEYEFVPGEEPSLTPLDPVQSSTGSYEPSRLSYYASPEAIADFIAGMEYRGKVVTVTSLVTFMPLYLNQRQVSDRATASGRGRRWTGDDWRQQGFMPLWRDSFDGRGFNYFGELYRLSTEGTGEFREFTYEYNIRRPSGALARYQTLYIPVESYLGLPGNPVPARIGISTVGDWRIVEAAPDGSE